MPLLKENRYKIDEKTVKHIAETISNEMAEKIYYSLLAVKHIPEIKSIQEGRSKGLRGKEIHDFLNKKAK